MCRARGLRLQPCLVSDRQDRREPACFSAFQAKACRPCRKRACSYRHPDRYRRYTRRVKAAAGPMPTAPARQSPEQPHSKHPPQARREAHKKERARREGRQEVGRKPEAGRKGTRAALRRKSRSAKLLRAYPKQAETREIGWPRRLSPSEIQQGRGMQGEQQPTQEIPHHRIWKQFYLAYQLPFVCERTQGDSLNTIVRSTFRQHDICATL